MNKYTIYCTEEQAKRAYELGAPIEANKDYSNGNVSDKLCVYGDIVNKDEWGVGECTILRIPTAEQMIGWLEDYGFNFAICKCSDGTFCNFFQKGAMKYYYTRKEATFAAIDAALDYLGKKE